MSEQQADYPTSGNCCAYRGCHARAWKDDSRGFCLYHSPENGKTEEAAGKVWAEARRKAKGTYPKFVGWHFPKDPDNKGFTGAIFQGGAWFESPTFEGDAWFQGATFEGEAGFKGATFHGDAWFGGAIVQGPAWFQGATFEGWASFQFATFHGDARFLEATFQKEARFRGSTFQENALFKDATFQGEARFSGAKFEAGVDIRFDTPPLLAWLWGKRPFRRAEQGETAYRLAKEAARARGDYRRAGEYHYAEQCAIEYGRRKKYGWKLWPPRFLLCLFEYVFARGIFGYGERPHRALIAAALVILLCGLLFWAHAGITPAGPDESPVLMDLSGFGKCMYFSAVTFTTLGYGDFQPKPGFFRALAGTEAFTGAALMALFIVGLTRKYMR